MQCIHTYITYISYISYIHTCIHAYIHSFIHTYIIGPVRDVAILDREGRCDFDSFFMLDQTVCRAGRVRWVRLL